MKHNSSHQTWSTLATHRDRLASLETRCRHRRAPTKAKKKQMENPNKQFRFIDLFAGLGGFHVALTRLGGEAVFASEWDTDLQELYRTNYGIDPWGDINKIEDPENEVPDHDVLTAGFPCQPFSKAGEQLGFEHTLQGQLFFKVLEVLDAKRPPRFILENVPNILRHKNGQTLSVMKHLLAELGYDVQIERLSPHHFGIPQIRERAYFVGSLDGLEEYQWPEKKIQPTSIHTVLDKEPKIQREIPEQTLNAMAVWDDFLKSSPEDIKLPSFPIWAMEFGATYPYEDETPAALQEELRTAGLAKYKGSFGKSLSHMSLTEQFASLPSHARRNQYQFPKWKRHFIRQNRDFYYSNHEWIDPWMERSNLQQFPSSLQKFEWNVQGGKRSLYDYVLQIRASGLRVKRTTTAPSLIAMTATQVPIIAWERRYMTPRECSRLQSLQGIQLPEYDVHAYKALGNAVNAEVVQAIAEPLVRNISTDVTTEMRS